MSPFPFCLEDRRINCILLRVVIRDCHNPPERYIYIGMIDYYYRVISIAYRSIDNLRKIRNIMKYTCICIITRSVLKSFSKKEAKKEKVVERKEKYLFVCIFLNEATFALF